MNLIIISQDECMGEGGKYLVKTGQNTVNLWVRPRMMIRSRRYYAPKLHACPWTFSLSTPSSDGRFFFWKYYYMYKWRNYSLLHSRDDLYFIWYHQRFIKKQAQTITSFGMISIDRKWQSRTVCQVARPIDIDFWSIVLDLTYIS